MEQAKKVWITPDELQEMFGISKSTQNKLRMKKAVPYSKIGQKVFYNLGKIYKWLEDAEVSV